MTENPYAASSQTALDNPSEVTLTNRSFSEIARSVFLAWEILRVVYVIILALVTFMAIGISGLFDLRLLRLIILGGLAANVAFFAGPSIETYARWLGYNRIWPRWFMFIGGTLISIVLTLGVLATELLPDQP